MARLYGRCTALYERCAEPRFATEAAHADSSFNELVNASRSTISSVRQIVAQPTIVIRSCIDLESA